MFPDDEHKISSPKFFSLTLTNEKGNRTFLYSLKFPEKFNLPIEDRKSKKAVVASAKNMQVQYWKNRIPLIINTSDKNQEEEK